MEAVGEFIEERLRSELPSWKFCGSPVEKLDEPMLQFCLDAIDANLGAHYRAMNGSRWRLAKAREMREEGLWYFVAPGRGFLSLKPHGDHLYIYEIQILDGHRGEGVGTKIMAAVHDSVGPPPTTGGTPGPGRGPPLNLLGTALTVFAENHGARKFYCALGYVPTEDSPRPLVLRGKTLEPVYYILERIL